jgi:hypothetical protein
MMIQIGGPDVKLLDPYLECIVADQIEGLEYLLILFIHLPVPLQPY